MIDSKLKLKNYCLRELGSPVINIEVDDTQLDDRIEEAIQFFMERHYDGVEEVYIKKTITRIDVANGFLIMPERMSAILNVQRITGIGSREMMDNYEYQFMIDMNDRNLWTRGGITDYYMTRSYLSLIDNIFGTTNRPFEFNRASNRLYVRDGIDDRGSNELLTSVVDMSDDAWIGDAATITINSVEIPTGKLEGVTIASAAASKFGFTQTIETTGYIRGSYTARFTFKSGTYTGKIRITLSDRNGTEINYEDAEVSANKWATFHVVGAYNTDHINDIVVKVETLDAAVGAGETFYVMSPSAYRNNFVIIRGYRELDAEDDIDIYNDPWLKRYCTQLFRRQWGANLSKYDQIQLPSGVTIQGDKIYQDAIQSLKELETEFEQKYMEPDLFFIG